MSCLYDNSLSNVTNTNIKSWCHIKSLNCLYFSLMQLFYIIFFKCVIFYILHRYHRVGSWRSSYEVGTLLTRIPGSATVFFITSILQKFVRNQALPITTLCHLGEFLGTEPKNTDHHSVTVNDDHSRKNEHDNELVPGEQDSLGLISKVSVAACLNYDCSFIVVV